MNVVTRLSFIVNAGLSAIFKLQILIVMILFLSFQQKWIQQQI